MNFLERIIQLSSICPDSIALVDEEKEVSYRELEERSNAIAHHLVAHNRSGQFNCAVILLPRSADVVWTYLGIIKADACVLCINDSSISQRELAIIRECTPHTIITTQAELRRFPEIAELSCHKLLLDELTWSEEDYLPINLSKAGHPAHITFTSGTTGCPKGVVYSLRNRSHIVQPIITEDMPLNASMRKACVMDLSYTMGILGALVPLINGGTAYIASSQLMNDIPALAQFARRHHINRILLPNSVVPLLLREPNHGITHILSSCERLENVNPEILEGIRLENNYGTSETGRITKYVVTGRETIIPIGTPDELVSVYLLDEQRKPVTDGQIGEIYVSSPGVAMGYLHDKVLTDERFLPCPFLPGERMFRTGDYAYRDKEEQFIYCGRQDGLVNIRGHRLHLGEIETAVLQLGTVRQAAAILFEGRLLCLYYSGEAEPCSIKDYLRHRLPRYMMPHHLIQVEALPLGNNGKVDRSQLVKPAIFHDCVDIQYASETERQLCSTMAEVLNLDPASVDPRDDFFSLGGDSLSAMQWICRFQQGQFSFATIYTHRSPREIAKHLSKQGSWSSISTATDEEARKQWQPFNSIMQGMVDYQLVYPDAIMWNVGQLYRLTDNVDLKRLISALEQVCRQHPALNSEVEKRDGTYGLRYHSEWQPVIEEVTIEGTVSDYISKQKYSFTMEAGRPLYRICLFHAKDGHYIFIIGHHLILDGSSFIVLHNEIDMAYRGETLPRDYFYTYLQQQYLSRSQPEYSAVCQTIRQSLEGHESPCMPTPIDNYLSTFLYPLSLHKVSSSTELISATMQAVAEITGQSKVQLDWTFHNRQLSFYKHSVGPLIRTTTVAADTALPRREWKSVIQSQLNLQMAEMNYDFTYCLEVEKPFSAEYIELNCLLPLHQRQIEKESLLTALPTPSLNQAAAYMMEVDIVFNEGLYELSVNYIKQRYDESYIRQFCQLIEKNLQV